LSSSVNTLYGSPLRAIDPIKTSSFDDTHLLSKPNQGINDISLSDLFDPMDVRFLVTFLEVTKTRHFGKAAENLYLTQSAVSARIRQLEEYFNTTLFIRYRNSIQLTPAGEKLIPFAESLAATLNDARNVLRESEVQYLTLGATPNASELQLHQALAGVKFNFPNISVRAEILNSEQLSRQLHERIVDLAIVTEPLKSDDLDTIKISESQLALYGTQEHLSANTLSDYVSIEWSAKVSEAILKQLPETKQAKLKSSSIRVGLDYMLANGGVAVLPHSIALPMVQQGKLIELTALQDLTISCYLSFMKEIKQTALLEYIEFLSHKANN
jgi:LysR family transcriptional regulator, flagellar master operon regulator